MDAFKQGFEFGQGAVNNAFAQNALTRYTQGDKGAINDLMRFNPQQAAQLQDQEMQQQRFKMAETQFQQEQEDRPRQQQIDDLRIQQAIMELKQSGDQAKIEQAKQEADLVGGLSYTLKQVPADQRAAWVQQNAPELQRRGIDVTQLGPLDDTTLDLNINQALGVKQLLLNDIAQQRVDDMAQYRQGQLAVSQQRANQQGANVQSQIAKRAQAPASGGKKGGNPWEMNWK